MATVRRILRCAVRALNPGCWSEAAMPRLWSPAADVEAEIAAGPACRGRHGHRLEYPVSYLAGRSGVSAVESKMNTGITA